MTICFRRVQRTWFGCAMRELTGGGCLRATIGFATTSSRKKRFSQPSSAFSAYEPVPTTGGGRKPETELDRLSNIIKTFNDQFGNIPWTDGDRVHKLITGSSQRTSRTGWPPTTHTRTQRNTPTRR